MASVQVAPNIQGRLWRSGEPQEDFEVAGIADYLGEPDALVWVDALVHGLLDVVVDSRFAAVEALDGCVETICSTARHPIAAFSGEHFRCAGTW